MREPTKDTSINALLARPSEQLSGSEIHTVKKALLNAVSTLSEAQLYDDVASAMLADPHSAHDLLLRQGEECPDGEYAFPKIRVALLEACVERMKQIESTWDPIGELAAGGPLDRAREAAFREEPGRWLPGATVSDVVLLHAPAFGVVRHGGRDHIWLYAAKTQGDDKLKDLIAFLDDRPGFGGIIVGPAALEEDLDLPWDCTFVPVDAGADSHTGGAA